MRFSGLSGSVEWWLGFDVISRLSCYLMLVLNWWMGVILWFVMIFFV